jgi:hypothetical protein
MVKDVDGITMARQRENDLRAVWNIKTGASMVDTALDYAGINADVTN